MTGGDGRATRQNGVDAGRLIGAFLVILLHCLPNPAYEAHLPLSTLLVGGLARVAVPFFFVASGSFLAIRREPLSVTMRRTIGRLFPLYLFWLLVYVAVFSTPLRSFSGQWKLSILWTGGPGFQLWFLPALGASQWLVATVVPRAGSGAALAITGAVAALGLWIIYGPSPQLSAPFWFPRLCQGPILVLAGHLIGRSPPRTRIGPAAVLTLLAYLLSLAEDAVIARVSGRPLTYEEFTISTCLFGTAAVLMARAPARAPLVPERWQPARLSLLIYCLHVLFLWPLLNWVGTGSLGQTLLLFGCVGGLSLAAALLLLRGRRVWWMTG